MHVLMCEAMELLKLQPRTNVKSQGEAGRAVEGMGERDSMWRRILHQVTRSEQGQWCLEMPALFLKLLLKGATATWCWNLIPLHSSHHISCGTVWLTIGSLRNTWEHFMDVRLCELNTDCLIAACSLLLSHSHWKTENSKRRHTAAHPTVCTSSLMLLYRAGLSNGSISHSV